MIIEVTSCLKAKTRNKKCPHLEKDEEGYYCKISYTKFTNCIYFEPKKDSIPAWCPLSTPNSKIKDSTTYAKTGFIKAKGE